MVDDEEFENVKRKLIRRSRNTTEQWREWNEQNDNEVDVQENDLDQVVADEELSYEKRIARSW